MNSFTTNRFDDDARTWDDKSHRLKLADEIADAIMDAVTIVPEMDILDFGCGTGLLSLRFGPEAASLTGLDNSAGMLEVFQEKAEQLNLNNVDTLKLNLDQGDKLTGNYDLIMSAMALHHVRNTEQVLRELFVALKPGGYLCIADLDPDNGLFHSDNNGVHHFGFVRDELTELFRTIGFSGVQVKTASTMRRSGNDGVERDFTIFLIVGMKS